MKIFLKKKKGKTYKKKYIQTGGADATRIIGAVGAVPSFGGDGGLATSAYVNSPDIAIDSTGIIYIADSANHRIRKVGLDGKISTIAGTGSAGKFVVDSGKTYTTASSAALNNPCGIAVNSDNNVIFCDMNNNRICKIDMANGRIYISIGADGVNNTALVKPYALSIIINNGLSNNAIFVADMTTTTG